ncbi:hypothetical protein MVEN_02323000 [Mycena venus]|uniref:DUF6589 domain-containing protein n=1 Tax=Mycena venus TaxID=2733690 RepID=A0A8H6X4N2_9AGAR|nr:hypothetical protein MVEN_02323000 [Mycena venus]
MYFFAPQGAYPPPPPRPNALYEAQFSEGIFDEVLNVPELPPGEKPQRRTRARFAWPKGTTKEDRLLVAFRCMQEAGFETIGDYFLAVLDHEDNKHPPVYHSVSSFLQCRGVDARTHPISIVQKIFADPRSKKRIGAHDEDLRFDLPRYALPPSQRLLPDLPQPAKNSTHNALINWALQLIVARWKQEADLLLDPFFGFVRERRRDEPAEIFSWSDVLNWSMTKSQETIAVNAPAMFACLTSVAVNDKAAKKLTRAAEDKHIPALSEASVRGREPAPEPEPTPGQASSSRPDSADADSDDSDTEHDGEAVPISTGVPPKMRRDPWLGVTVAILMLLYFRYRYAIVFPTFIGIFLFTCNAHRDVFVLLCRVGLSVGYSTVLDTLHVLAMDSATQLHAFGASVQVCQPMFLLLFDNINKMQRAWQQVLGRQDTVSSGTAATLVGLEDVTEEAMDSRPFIKNVEEKKRLHLTLDKLVDDIDWNHLEGVGSGTAAGVWTKHVPSLRVHGRAVTKKFRVTYAKHRLRLRKSVVHPMRTTDIDEAPTTGLWHLKWNWQKAIFRLHWFEPTGKSIFGLHHDVELLTRNKFNPVKCDFYPAHHILEDRFEALMLDALRLLCEEKTGIVHPPKTALIDGLELYFNAKSNGPFKDITFEELDEFSHVVYRRYMCNDAYDDAQGDFPRDPKIHGPPTVPNAAPVPEPVVSDDEEEELACNFLYEFPLALRNAILNNYLVNTTGLLGHWLELDLLQEHYNFLDQAPF